MRKLAVAGALTLACLSARADPWMFVVDSNDGMQRLLVDIKSYKETPFQDKFFLSADFAYFDGNTGLQNPSMNVMIEAETCVDTGAGGGGKMIITNPDDSIENEFWSSRGPRMYDAMGLELCATFKDRVKRWEAKRKKK